MVDVAVSTTVWDVSTIVWGSSTFVGSEGSAIVGWIGAGGRDGAVASVVCVLGLCEKPNPAKKNPITAIPTIHNDWFSTLITATIPVIMNNNAATM